MNELFILFVLGLLLNFNPCSFVMFPILLSVLLTYRNLLLYILFSAIGYAALGAVFLAIGIQLQFLFQENIYQIIVGVLMIIIGSLAVTGRLYRFSKSAIFVDLGPAALGLLSVLAFNPCSTPMFANIVLLITKGGYSLAAGTGLFFLIGLAAGLPFLGLRLVGSYFTRVSINCKYLSWVNIMLNIGFILYGVYLLLNSLLIGLH